MLQGEVQRLDNMTKIFIQDKNGQKEICCKGHSGYAVSGADIVCAGISSLVFAWAELCMQLDKKDSIQVNRLEIKDGFSRIIISDPANVTENAFKMLKLGFELLEENYEKNIKLYKVWEDFQKEIL